MNLSVLVCNSFLTGLAGVFISHTLRIWRRECYMLWNSSTAPKSFMRVWPLLISFVLWFTCDSRPPSKQHSPSHRRWNCSQRRRGSGNQRSQREENHWKVCGFRNQRPSRTSTSLDRCEEERTCSVWFRWSTNGEGFIYRTHPTSCLSSARGFLAPPVGHTRGYLEFWLHGLCGRHFLFSPSCHYLI